jgi:RimJ/RimL family protein N-acetyltransferase
MAASKSSARTRRRPLAAFAGHDEVWTYISTDGPFATATNSHRSSGHAFAAADDPYAYAIIDTAGHRAVGYLTLMRIVPQMRVIEVGHVLYSPALQRTPLGTETQYLLARYVFETLGYRRYEWKCNSFNAAFAARGAALRFRLRGHVPPIHDRQGPQPRRRLVLHARQRMARAQANFERWLAARRISTGRPVGDPVDAGRQKRFSLAAIRRVTPKRCGRRSARIKGSGPIYRVPARSPTRQPSRPGSLTARRGTILIFLRFSITTEPRSAYWP